MKDSITAVILSGGLGTRIRSVVSNVPKGIALVNNRPFITYIFDQLISLNVTNVIVSIGHMAEKIEKLIGDQYKSLKIIFSYEEEPLGTAGALRNGKNLIKSELCLVLNGDSYIDFNLDLLTKHHLKKKSNLTIIIKFINNANRYGSIALNKDNEIIKFKEKDNRLKSSFINAGVYLLNTHLLKLIPKITPCSLEYDFLPELIGQRIYGYESKGEFIDIGTPKSFKEAQFFFKDLN